MAMLRHRARDGQRRRRCGCSTRRARCEDVIYRDELDGSRAGDGFEVVHTLTRAQPPGWTATRGGSTPRCSPRSPGRPSERRASFVCGPTRFVEAAADGLVELGYDAASDQDRALRTDGRLRWRSRPEARRQRDRRAAARALRHGDDRRRRASAAAAAPTRRWRGSTSTSTRPGIVVRCRHCEAVMIRIVRPGPHLARPERHREPRAP